MSRVQVLTQPDSDALVVHILKRRGPRLEQPLLSARHVWVLLALTGTGGGRRTGSLCSRMAEHAQANCPQRLAPELADEWSALAWWALQFTRAS